MDLYYYFASAENLIRNCGEYIFFEDEEIISLLNTCNILAVIFKNSVPSQESRSPYFSISEYINNINNMYNTLESKKSGELFEARKVCDLLQHTSKIIACDYININVNMLEDIKLEITPFDELIKKVILLDKYKYGSEY